MVKNLSRIMMLLVSVLLIGGAVLLIWLTTTEDERNVMKVNLNSEETKAIHFENLSLIPGESCEYSISMQGERAKSYDVRLNFAETEEKTLKNFARVTITVNEETVCDELLATAFEREDIGFSVEFEEEKTIDLKVTFYMPLDVGNEAKNAEALFDLLITASNE